MDTQSVAVKAESSRVAGRGSVPVDIDAEPAESIEGDGQSADAVEPTRQPSSARPFPPAAIATMGIMLIFWAVYGLLMSSVAVTTGDEAFYLAGSERIWGVVGVGPYGDLALSNLGRSLVGPGWFLPGVSALLAPIGLLGADVVAGRWYMGVVNLALLVAVTRQVIVMFGRPTGMVFAVVVTLNPGFGLLAFTMWGDTAGGLLLVWVVLSAVGVAARLRVTGGRLSVQEVLALGVGLAALVYLRPPLIFAAPIVAVLIGWSTFRGDQPADGSTPWTRARAGLMNMAALTVIVSTLILPWSALVSWKTESRYLLTTAADLGWIMAFADEADVSAVGTTYGAWNAHIGALAEANGTGYKEAAKAERSRLARNVSAGEYWERVGQSHGRYLQSENTFPSRFLRLGDRSPEMTLRDRTFDVLFAVNTVVWFVLPGLVVASLVALWRSRAQLGLAAVATALFVVALSFPWMSAVHGRHIIDFVALASLILAVATGRLLAGRTASLEQQALVVGPDPSRRYG